MRDPYLIPASGPKRLTASIEFDQPASVLLQLVAGAIQKMRRTDTGRAVWTLDTDYGSDGGSLWLNAIATVQRPFRLNRMADIGPLQTTVSMTCAVTLFRKNDRSFATYAVDFIENNYDFIGGDNEELVLGTCARIVSYLVEKRLLNPDQVGGFWRMEVGSWNQSAIVEPGLDPSAAGLLSWGLGKIGMVATGAPDAGQTLAWIVASVRPNPRQIAASGLRLDRCYKYTSPDAPAERPSWYIRFFRDGTVNFVQAKADEEAMRLLGTEPSVAHSPSAYQVIETRVRFQVWSRGFTVDFDGSVTSNVLETEGLRREDNVRGQAFWQLIGGGE